MSASRLLQRKGCYRLNLCAEHRLGEADVQGYPVIASNGSNMLVGYIGRSEIRYIIGKLVGSGRKYQFLTNGLQRSIEELVLSPMRLCVCSTEGCFTIPATFSMRAEPPMMTATLLGRALGGKMERRYLMSRTRTLNSWMGRNTGSFHLSHMSTRYVEWAFASIPFDSHSCLL